MGRGYLVRFFDLEEIDEVYEVRLALEDLAIRTLAGRLTPEVIEGLWATWASAPDEGSPRDTLAGDEGFHIAIATASGNLTLLEFLETVNHRIHIVRGIDFTVKERRAASKTEHREILSAVIEGRTDQAAEQLRAHILRSKAICERLATEGLAMVYGPRRGEGLDLVAR